MTTPRHFDTKFLLRSGFFAGLLLGVLAGGGCANAGGLGALSIETVAAMSPAPQILDTSSALGEAQRYANAHPGAQIALGSGDSMLPLYRDNTVIVIQKLPMSELKRGMTVVYVSKGGWPVAHALVEKSSDGWVVTGLNNPNCDSEAVSEANYAGVVVKAYQTTVNPMLALSRELSTETDSIAMANPSTTNALEATP